MQQEFASLGAQLSFLKNDYERQLKLFNENVNSEKKYLQAESAYKSSLAQHNGLKKKLQLFGVNVEEVQKGNFYNKLSVKAPISGSISKINIVRGQYVSNAESLLQIVNNDEVHLTLQIFENDISFVKVDQRIHFTTPSGGEYTAKIHLISPTLNPETKTIEVHADILDSGHFYDGMFVQAKITTTAKLLKAIPANAVLKEGEKYFILVLDKEENGEKFFKKTPITVTQRNEQFISFKEIDELKNKLIITEGANMVQKDE